MAKSADDAVNTLLENGWFLDEIDELLGYTDTEYSHNKYGYWITDPDGNLHYDTGYLSTVINYSMN